MSFYVRLLHAIITCNTLQNFRPVNMVYAVVVCLSVCLSVCLMTNEDLSSNCVRIAPKVARFDSINSEIIVQKFTKFVHHVAGLLTFNVLKTSSWSADPLSNARATSKGRSRRYLQKSPKFNWLSWQCSLRDRKVIYQIIKPIYQFWNFNEDWSIRFWHTGCRTSTIKK